MIDFPQLSILFSTIQKRWSTLLNLLVTDISVSKRLHFFGLNTSPTGFPFQQNRGRYDRQFPKQEKLSFNTMNCRWYIGEILWPMYVLQFLIFQSFQAFMPFPFAVCLALQQFGKRPFNVINGFEHDIIAFKWMKEYFCSSLYFSFSMLHHGVCLRINSKICCLLMKFGMVRNMDSFVKTTCFYKTVWIAHKACESIGIYTNVFASFKCHKNLGNFI